MPTTIVVGAGWAGLNCAYELTKAGHQVQLIEAAPQIGGRSRSIKFQDSLVDNGQHIGLGAYNTLRSIVKELNLSEQQLFKILPMEIIAYGNKPLRLKLPNLPVPLNLILGIITARNIPWSSKSEILKFAKQLRQINFTLRNDCTVLELLQNYHQSEYVIEHIWEPIALAAMSTAITKASAQVFINILQQVFCYTTTNSNWYLPAVDLSALLPTQIAKFLTQNGSQIIYNQTVKEIQLQDRTINVYSNSQNWRADHVVLATPPWQTLKILAAHPDLQHCCHALSQFSYEPITTIYFQFPQPIQLPYPMLGILNATCQWIFDRAFAAQPNILSAIITGTTATKFTNQTMLSQHVWQEIISLFPHLPKPIATKVICEKRAAFTCDVAIQTVRPQPETALRNLWLSGDYLQTGLPSTLEGALLSGKQTATAILKSDGKL